MLHPRNEVPGKLREMRIDENQSIDQSITGASVSHICLFCWCNVWHETLCFGFRFRCVFPHAMCVMFLTVHPVCLCSFAFVHRFLFLEIGTEKI